MTMRPPGTTERGPVPEGHVGRSEAAGDHDIETMRVLGSETSGVSRTDRDAVVPAEPMHHALEKIGPLRPSIQQCHVELRTVPGDDQPGYAPAGSQIDDRAGRRRNRRDESLCMRDDLGDRAGTEESEAL